jgi:ProQ/FINO family
MGPHPIKRKILSLPLKANPPPIAKPTVTAASLATPVQKPVNAPQTAAGVVRVGGGPGAHNAGPTPPKPLPTAAWAARKLARAQALTWLSSTHPAVFGAVAKPLALGIGKLIWPAAKAEGIRRPAFNAAMKYHTTSIRYLEALARDGAQRCDLTGNAIEGVSLEHRELAQRTLTAIRAQPMAALRSGVDTTRSLRRSLRRRMRRTKP